MKTAEGRQRKISGRELGEICREKEADSLCDQLYNSPPFLPFSNNFLSAHRKGIYRMCLWEAWGLGVPCIDKRQLGGCRLLLFRHGKTREVLFTEMYTAHTVQAHTRLLCFPVCL